MNLIRRYNEIMGPKDERLEAEESRAMRTSAWILLAGCVVSLYYGLMLEQVAFTTDHPLLTPLGEHVVPVRWLLLLTILVACATSIIMQIRSGSFSTHTRFAEIDRIPWDFVVVCALVCGAVVGVLSCGMRILAEIQVVGIGEVAWAGDIAMGIVFFGMGFAAGFVALALSIKTAIDRRRHMEEGLEG